ncbi:MAG: hypothetical protein J6386_19550 [Candidatus Synoicihabitans palmerolidicus]|nr:hypothetical protein [Candidatus Synoicihabitans palmerolidicus]
MSAKALPTSRPDLGLASGRLQQIPAAADGEEDEVEPESEFGAGEGGRRLRPDFEPDLGFGLARERVVVLRALAP